MLIREGELQAGAHARVRELATMTAMEPKTGLVFRSSHLGPSSVHRSVQERSTIKSTTRARSCVGKQSRGFFCLRCLTRMKCR
jgi:hypothetical protein